jgi:hypothetical protein
MKCKAILPVSLFILVGCWNLNAQQVMPAGASDKGPDKGDIKARSIELERIDRDAHKPDAKNPEQPNPASAAKFEEVKQDFETLQRLQNDVIAEYTTKRKMDYSKISNAADQMNKSGTRLEANLFPPAEDTKKKKKSKEPVKTEAPATLPADLKATIIELDNTLAAFVGSPMFTNPQVVNPDENAKAHANLKRILLLTTSLKAHADKPAN